jgi:hypothetical protein
MLIQHGYTTLHASLVAVVVMDVGVGRALVDRLHPVHLVTARSWQT